MKQMQGKQSILFQNPVKILSHACVGGKKEGEGPIGKHLDLIVEDPMFGKENWEESESCFLKTAGEIALRKGKKKKKDVRMAFCGDLLGQLIASSFGIAELEIPYYGVYGACSSIGAALSIGAMAVNGGFADFFFQPGTDVGVGTRPLDEVRAGAALLGLRLVAVGAAHHRHDELALAVAPAHNKAHAHRLHLHGGGLFAHDLDDFFQRQVLGLVLVHGVDDLHGGQRIARKTNHDVAVDLAHLGQVVLDDVGLVAGDGFLNKAAIADHGAECVTANS